MFSYDNLAQDERYSIEERRENIKKKVLSELAQVEWEKYDKDIFLTPLPQTLPFFKGGKCKVIAGTKDKYLAAEELQSYCEEHGISYRQFEGVGHSMEDTQDVLRSLEIMKEIVKELYKEYGIKGE